MGTGRVPIAVVIALLLVVVGCANMIDEASGGGGGKTTLLWSTSQLDARTAPQGNSVKHLSVTQPGDLAVEADYQGIIEVVFQFAEQTPLPGKESGDIGIRNIDLARAFPGGSHGASYRVALVIAATEPAFVLPSEDISFEHPFLHSLRLENQDDLALVIDVLEDVDVALWVDAQRHRIIMTLWDCSVVQRPPRWQRE